MMRLLSILALACTVSCGWAQQLSPYNEAKAIDRARQTVRDFESAFALLTNPHITDRDERDVASYRIGTLVRADARFENDLVPELKNTTVGLAEYLRIAANGYASGGLSYRTSWTAAEFQPAADGYLVLLYGTKSLSGNYEGRQPLRLEAAPCRAGVFLKLNSHHIAEAQLGFLDTDLTGKGIKTIALTDRQPGPGAMTLPDAVDQLAAQLARQHTGASMAVEELTFQGLGISNDFSKQITGMLKAALTRQPALTLVNPAEQTATAGTLKLTGSYLPAGEMLSITMKVNTGQELHAAVPLTSLPDSDFEPAPRLVQEASRVRELMTLAGIRNEAPAGALRIEVSTDKGPGPQLYREGDLMRLKVRASKPCMVRMIYQDASRNIVRLRNADFRIPSEAAGQWVDIPESFECAAPFGLEMLMAFATEGNFKPIGKTETQDGITLILDDLRKILDATVGSSVASSMTPITTEPRRKPAGK